MAAALALAAVGLAAVGLAAAADPPPRVVAITQAELAPLSAWSADAETTIPVRLPDPWRARGPTRPVAAVYRIELPLPDGVPPRMQALRFTHVSARVVMHLNGGLLYERGAALADAHAIRTLPLLVDVPPALLVPGRNLLELRVQHGQWQRAGLAGVSFGDRGLLAQAHQRYLLWQVDAPQIVNLLAMAVSTVLLLIWWLRRSEVALGLFGALFLITSFRNYGYFAELLIPAALADWMQFGGVLCGSLLLLPFLWRHGGWPQPRLERALLWTGAVLLLLGAGLMAVYPAGMFGLRLMVYPGTLALSVLACGVACRAAWRSRRGADLWIAVGLALIVVGSVHDFALLAGQLGMEAAYWTPYLTPVLLGVFSLQMVGRMLGAMDTAEQLSQALEQRVAQRTRELAAANDARNRFIAVASHDLRQPLNAVGLLVGTLRERIRFPEVRTLVDKIQASVDGMAALLQSLLDLSRLDVGGAAPRLDDVPLAGLLGALRAELEPLAQQRGLRLRFAPTRVVVRTDRALLAGMLRNLVGNAIRYTPQGAVLVGVRRRGASAWLQVIDTGLGIDPAEQALVFDEFYRGNAAGATQVPGAGLGLAIVRRSADALGHALVLRSAPGRGTLMAIELPLAAAGEAWPGAGAAPGADADSRRLVGNFVVVVEDDVLARDALGLLLRQWGCHVLAAPSAAQALAELQGHLRSPDLLLCDFHLGPGPDGLQAIDALRRAVGETVPALLMTAELPAAQRAAMGRQDVPMLAKPVTPTALLRALVACLDTPPTGAG